MRKQAIGQKSAPRSIDIEKGAIIKFAQAIEDDNPVFNDEMAARESR
ncbi:MAG: MaoC family dehydratase N-terminal domain-containing protein, partial [Dehalococcoidia bacterium]|nr:MaoC family dehydratase N-terminal domain-containing protein [Dehalococcoidia bacterium]